MVRRDTSSARLTGATDTSLELFSAVCLSFKLLESCHYFHVKLKSK